MAQAEALGERAGSAGTDALREKRKCSMQVVAAIKIVPDDQDIQVAADRSLDFSKARPVVSEYDLNALEAAVQLAAATGGSAIAVTAGGRLHRRFQDQEERPRPRAWRPCT